MKEFKSKAIIFVSSPILFYFLLGLYPVILLISKNWFVYETRQFLFLLIVPFFTGLIALIIVSIVWFIKKYILNRLPVALHHFLVRFIGQTGIWKVILSLIGFLLFYILLEESIDKSKIVIIGSIACIIITCFIVRKIGFYYVNILLLVMTLLATGELVYSLSTKSIGNRTLVESIDKEIFAKTKFKKTPNIYLIHLEAYQSPVAMKRLYNLDNRAFLKELENMGFFISQNTFSNYFSTLQSVGSIFLQGHHYCRVAAGLDDALGIRDLVGGRLFNPVLSTFKYNGYKIIYLHPDSYVFMGSNYLDYYYPHNSIHDSMLIFQSGKINWIRSQIFDIKKPNNKNTNTGDKNEFAGILWNYLENGLSGNRPSFFFIKDVGLSHSPSNGSYTWKNESEGWVYRYRKLVEERNPKILKMVSIITDRDPNGIIILYGDHGAWKYRDIYVGDKKDVDINKLIYERKQLNCEDIALDLFGTFLAVRYPGGNSQILDGETHVNIFRKLFSDLSQNNDLLKDKPANDSFINYRNKLYQFVRDGKALQKIEAMDIPE